MYEENNVLPQDVEEVNLTAERRKEQLEMRLRGAKRKDIVESLSAKYGVVTTTIDQDWARRDDWLLDVVGMTDLTSLVASTVGSFNLSQSHRQRILSDVMAAADRLVQEGAALENSEALASIWSSVMRIVNDIDSAESKKAELLMKLGVLREAPKEVKIDKREVTIHHTVDWEKAVANMSDTARREFFEALEKGHSPKTVIDVTPE